jgi:hypothetical protein
VYTFEEVDAPNFYSTGDVIAPNDNLVPNIAVSESMNITSINFFDAPKDLNDDDDDDLNDDGREDDDDDEGARRRGDGVCHSLFWWLYGHCYDHVFSEHTTVAVISVLVLLLLCVICCVFTVLFSIGRIPFATSTAGRMQSPPPPPAEQETPEPRVETSAYAPDFAADGRQSIFSRKTRKMQQADK